jgi:hypothetical protein
MTREAWQHGGRLHALTLLIAVLTSGCLSHFYEIPRTELERLAQTPPEQRGQDVYAVQQFSTDSEPEPAPDWSYPPGEPPPGYSLTVHGHWVPSFYAEYGAPTYEPPPAYHSASPVSYDGSPVHDASPVTEVASDDVSSSAAQGASSLGSIKGMDKLLVAVIVVGVAVGVGLAASEGARYEGRVAVHPRHPVHLRYHSGSWRTVALDELTPEHLRGIESAALSGHEGAGLWLRGAAPLNRAGFSYQFGAGHDTLALPGWRDQRSLGFRFALGYYPTKQLGLLAESRLQRGDEGGDSFYNVRLGLEAQWYPIALWRLHLGPFVGGGQAWSASAGATLPVTKVEQPYVSYGALAEFEVSTRLGLTFRWGQEWLPTASADTHRLVSAWSVGLAVY